MSPQHAEGTLHVENQVLITIYVREDRSAPKGYRLEIYPGRREDVEVFRHKDPDTYAGAKPQELRWAVVGLGGKQKIQIQAKDEFSGKKIFDDEYWIDGTKGSNTVCSGPVKGERDAGTWRYSIILWDDGGTKLASLDPDVDIKNDP